MKPGLVLILLLSIATAAVSARPRRQAGQTDQDTLPPYEVLDVILEDYIEDMKTVKQIAAERGLNKDLVLKIVRMVERSEYKRQQAAPGLKISEKAFGVGRRFPIAARSEISA